MPRWISKEARAAGCQRIEADARARTCDWRVIAKFVCDARNYSCPGRQSSRARFIIAGAGAPKGLVYYFRPLNNTGAWKAICCHWLELAASRGSFGRQLSARRGVRLGGSGGRRNGRHPNPGPSAERRGGARAYLEQRGAGGAVGARAEERRRGGCRRRAPAAARRARCCWRRAGPAGGPAAAARAENPGLVAEQQLRAGAGGRQRSVRPACDWRACCAWGGGVWTGRGREAHCGAARAGGAGRVRRELAAGRAWGGARRAAPPPAPIGRPRAPVVRGAAVVAARGARRTRRGEGTADSIIRGDCHLGANWKAPRLLFH